MTPEQILTFLAIYLPCGGFVGIILWRIEHDMQRMRQDYWDQLMAGIER